MISVVAAICYLLLHLCLELSIKHDLLFAAHFGVK